LSSDNDKNLGEADRERGETNARRENIFKEIDIGGAKRASQKGQWGKKDCKWQLSESIDKDKEALEQGYAGRALQKWA